MPNNHPDPSLTSSYSPPKNVKKIPKGDKGFSMVKKALNKGLSEKRIKGFESWCSENFSKNS